jgi:hypothetical protein
MGTHEERTNVRNEVHSSGAHKVHTEGALCAHGMAVHVVFDVLKPERSDSPQRRPRPFPDRLRALAVLPGRRRVHLGCLRFNASPSDVDNFVALCLRRLLGLGVSKLRADALSARIRARVIAKTSAGTGSSDGLRARARVLARLT